MPPPQTFSIQILELFVFILTKTSTQILSMGNFFPISGSTKLALGVLSSYFSGPKTCRVHAASPPHPHRRQSNNFYYSYRVEMLLHSIGHKYANCHSNFLSTHLQKFLHFGSWWALHEHMAVSQSLLTQPVLYRALDTPISNSTYRFRPYKLRFFFY